MSDLAPTDPNTPEPIEVLKTSSEWMEGKNFFILNPDGWDRTDFETSWMELISEDEFNSRVAASTVMEFPTPDSDSEPEA